VGKGLRIRESERPSVKNGNQHQQINAISVKLDFSTHFTDKTFTLFAQAQNLAAFGA
jgi:hypothetical protein